mgnify:CR=1 FL=1
MPNDQFRRGIVVDGRAGQIQVQFEDGMVSPWLDVAQGATRGARMYVRPDVGSMVACMMDRTQESGTVVGALYSEADPAPADNASTVHMEFDDGSVMTYDGGALNFSHASGLTFNIAGGIMTVDGNLTVTGDLQVAGSTDLKNTTINGIAQSGS